MICELPKIIHQKLLMQIANLWLFVIGLRKTFFNSRKNKELSPLLPTSETDFGLLGQRVMEPNILSNPQQKSVLYRSTCLPYTFVKELTPQQKALLAGPNYPLYQSIVGLSGKDIINISRNQIIQGNISEAETMWDVKSILLRLFILSTKNNILMRS